MEDERFDDFARSLAAGGTRRAALRLLAGGALGALLNGLGPGAAAACVPAGKKCGKRKRCCDGARCQGRKCVCKGGRTKCADGRCRYCCGDDECPTGVCRKGVCQGPTCQGALDYCDIGPTNRPTCREKDEIDWCWCLTTVSGGSICASVKSGIGCGPRGCKSDADCLHERYGGYFPKGSACVPVPCMDDSNGEDGTCADTTCVKPCTVT